MLSQESTLKGGGMSATLFPGRCGTVLEAMLLSHFEAAAEPAPMQSHVSGVDEAVQEWVQGLL
jgi:hypothetical protein